LGLGNALVIVDLFDSIGLSCCAGLIAPDVVARDGDTIAGGDLTGLEDDDFEAGSVARARAAKVSMMMLIQSS